MSTSFLRRYAKTQHFTLGKPRSITLRGDRLFFLRTKSGDDPRQCLWMIHLEKGAQEKLLIDPLTLKTTDGDIPETERRRRERAREAAGGIVTYTVDESGNTLAFVLGGDVYVHRLGGKTHPIVTKQAAYDPRLSPDGTKIAYVCEGSLYVRELTSATAHKIAGESDSQVTWGQADFIAAEEIGRLRGYWWSPDSTRIIACRVDTAAVPTWHIADPAQPDMPPTPMHYPKAGSNNPEVSLAIIDVASKAHTSVSWPHRRLPYVVDVVWEPHGLYLTVQSRDQRTVELRTVMPNTGRSKILHTDTNPDWVELMDGLPMTLPDGSILSVKDDFTRQLALNGTTCTPKEINVRSFGGVTAEGGFVFTAWQPDNPSIWHVWERTPQGEVRQLTREEGVHSAFARGDTLVIAVATLDSVHPKTRILRRNQTEWQEVGTIASHAETPEFTVHPEITLVGERRLATAVIWPSDYDGRSKLPVLMDPYGGPHAQQVVMAQSAYLEAQWFADQGFAVVIVDGRGMPGRGPAWEKAIKNDLITPILQDQVDALQALGRSDPRLDLTRVGIKGWSFGGYLAAYAVVRRPDIFHAAIAGAPVTDWRLYDTHYTERYLGDPAANAAAYDACSLLREAGSLSRPLLLIHGLSDDNVVVAHSLQLSAALLAAGRPHSVLPLSGVTHMASQEVVMENLAKLQLEFLRSSLNQVA